MAAILRIFDAIDGVRDYVVCSEQLIIGRDKSRVDICVRDMSVSRTHLKLFLRDGLYYIEDLESSCGTLVNNRSVQTHKLSYGDHIQLGSTVIEFLPNSENVNEIEQVTDTVDALMSQYKVLPTKMQLSYRVLRVPARSIYRPGDTVVVGRGGLLLHIELDPEDLNYVLELKITWPDGLNKILLGEVIATIKQSKLVCLKLHHLSENKMNSLFDKLERGSWIRVSGS